MFMFCVACLMFLSLRAVYFVLSHVPAVCASAKSVWALLAVTDPDKNTSARLLRKRLSSGSSSKVCPMARFDCILGPG